jgi:hypothetical protein
VYWATFDMLAASAVVWAVGVYAFVEENTWPYALALAGVRFVLAAYNALQMRAGARRYSLSEKDGKTAVLRYFFDPILLLIGK